MKLPGKCLFLGRKYSPFCIAWLRVATQRSRTASWVHKVLFLTGYTVGNILDHSPFWEQTPTWEWCGGCRAFLLTQQPKPWTKDSPLVSSSPAPLCLSFWAVQSLTCSRSPHVVNMLSLIGFMYAMKTLNVYSYYYIIYRNFAFTLSVPQTEGEKMEGLVAGQKYLWSMLSVSSSFELQNEHISLMVVGRSILKQLIVTFK